MIVIYSDDHEAAPLLEDPLEEHNAERRVRPIYKKVRKVRGKTGWLLRRYGHFFGAPKDDPIGLGHHALQIGAYVYEMTREKGLVGQRLTGDQVWPSTVMEVIIGYTEMSDEGIQIEAMKAQMYSRSRNGGNYHIKHNNCQHFIDELQRRLLSSSPAESVTSLPGEVHGVVEYTPTPISRHDSVASKTEKQLEIRVGIRSIDQSVRSARCGQATVCECRGDEHAYSVVCMIDKAVERFSVGLPAAQC